MIVVGVDGSAGSDAALRWALEEAKLRGVSLRVVHVYQLPQLPLDGVVMGAPGLLESAGSQEDAERLRAASEAEARRVVEEALARAGTAAASVETERAAIEGPPADSLIGAGRDAELLVLGSRGRGGFAGLLLGSVSQQCAQHPSCPLVILPPVDEVEGKRG